MNGFETDTLTTETVITAPAVRTLAHTDYFEDQLITGMLAALRPGDMAVYGTQNRIER